MGPRTFVVGAESFYVSLTYDLGEYGDSNLGLLWLVLLLING